MTTTSIRPLIMAAIGAVRALLPSTLLWASVLHAQIVSWDINARTAVANNPLGATTLDSHFSSASLTLGAGVNASAAANTFGGSGFDQTSFGAAIGAGDHISFTLTPAAGTSFSLLSMSLLFGVGTAVTNFNIALTSSVAGFTSGNALWNYSFATTAPAAQTIALTDFPVLDNMISPVEFRLYGWRDAAGTTTFRLRDNAGDDLTVSSSFSAVPEPSAYAGIAGCAGLVAAWYLRGRKRRQPAVARCPVGEN